MSAQFHQLRACICVVQDGEKLLVLERSDGLGFCFPGGMCHPNEPELNALIRELREETGLLLTHYRKVLTYQCAYRFPHLTTVYEARVDGELRGSWEGKPCWLPLKEVESLFFPGQMPVIDLLRYTVNFQTIEEPWQEYPIPAWLSSLPAGQLAMD